MGDANKDVLLEIELALVQALGKADSAGEALLGAKIEDAIHCVREIIADR